ncbi:MAG: LysR family transcriptional regulator [Verrucomicrobiales bacterium]|nr:LysR family transcriptional regulator [Verrucomicrobiales bacterium]|tara:strand:+ start:2302 stop:3180 length:879 start_codon:yes stop_codon:yes gene_type:complete
MLNIHHLELFYYVARHGGIMPAVRNIPYGIQQPAVSGQILQLEEYLGGPLFQRRPFQLTPAGEELYEFVKPFFDGVETVAERLRGGAIQNIRVAATAIVLRDHLPEMLPHIRKKFPKLKMTLREGVQAEVSTWLTDGEIDLGVTVLEGKPPAGIHQEAILEVPMVLLVPTSLKFKTVDAILKQDRISQTLISLPPNDSLSRVFLAELNKRKMAWPVGMEVNALDLVETYASNGFGIGLTVAIPKRKPPKAVRVLPLNDFPKIAVGAMWQGKLGVIGRSLVDLFQDRAKELDS